MSFRRADLQAVSSPLYYASQLCRGTCRFRDAEQ